MDADPQPAVIFEELPEVPAGLELQGDPPAEYAGDRARSRVLGIQDRLRVVAVTQKVAMGIRSDELRAQVWSAASSARRRVRTAEDTAKGAVSTAVGKAKRHLLQQARDSLVAVGKRLGSVRKEVRKGAVTGVKATVAINELNRKGAVKAREDAQLAALTMGVHEGARGTAAIDKQVSFVKDAGRKKADGYPKTDRGKAQKEAVEEVANDFATTLAEPREDIDTQAISMGSSRSGHSLELSDLVLRDQREASCMEVSSVAVELTDVSIEGCAGTPMRLSFTAAKLTRVEITDTELGASGGVELFDAGATMEGLVVTGGQGTGGGALTITHPEDRTVVVRGGSLQGNSGWEAAAVFLEFQPDDDASVTFDGVDFGDGGESPTLHWNTINGDAGDHDLAGVSDLSCDRGGCD